MHKNSQNIIQFVSPVVCQKTTVNKSNHILFNDSKIKALKSKKRKVFWCLGQTGFGIRVSPSGNKTWVFEYRCDGHHRLLTLGKYPRMSLSQARVAFSKAFENVEKGIDPATAHLRQREETRNAITVAELVPLYIDFCQKCGQKRTYDKERALKKEVISRIGHLKVKDVTFRDISTILNDIFMEKGTVALTRRLLSYCRTMFRFAKNNLGLLEINPCMDLNAPAKPTSRKRSLSPREVYLFWNNMDNTQMSHVVKLALKFMLATLARGIEVRHMKWSEVDLKDRIWIIPADKAKNGQQQLVPLSRYAIQIIEEMKQYSQNFEFVFGWNSTIQLGTGQAYKELRPLSTTALSHSLRLNFDSLGINEKFHPHDLRRTGASLLTSLSYSRDWVSRLLNHRVEDITGRVYDTYDYYEEKRAGIELIAYVLDRILSSQSAELVPSIKNLRNEIAKKGLIHTYINDSINDEQVTQVVDMRTDHQAISLAPVSYSLSYDQGLLSA